jgi:hypothetical protein
MSLLIFAGKKQGPGYGHTRGRGAACKLAGASGFNLTMKKNKK